MKKSVKIILAIAIIVAMCLCLGGCRQLDDLRAQHGVWTKDGSKDSITLNGKEYIRVEGENAHRILYLANNISPIYVTDKDVPVLLSMVSYNSEFSISKDQKFIFGSIVTEQTVENFVTSVSTALDENAIYARKDVYDKIKDNLNGEIEYTHYGYTYWYYDEKEDTDKIEYYNFTDSETEVINEIINTVEPVENDELPFDVVNIAVIEKISEDNCFADFAYDLFYDTISGKYYLASYNEADEDYSFIIYEVPQQYNTTMRNLTEKLKFELEQSGIIIK